MIKELTTFFVILMALFCFWRGVVAIKTRKFAWRGKSFRSWGTSSGIVALIAGLLLIIFGVVILYMDLKKYL